MNKKIGIPIIIGLLILIGIGIYIFVKNTNSSNEEKKDTYEANKTSSEENISNNGTSSNTNSEANNTTPPAKPKTEAKQTPPASTPKIVEEQLATFSTKIYSNDKNRTKNMQITTTSLNGFILKNGATFSFCNTIGPSTSAKGYTKADIYDNNGKKKKGYGGGNCQVSSTLYNAVLSVPSLTVVERHPHSNHVPYVPDGKDAAVAYGSYDFKFRNDSGNDVKILSSVSNGLVNITLNTLKPQ